MGTRKLIILVVAAALGAGCSASSLKASKDDGFKFVSQGLPDGEYIYNPSLPSLSKLPDPTWVGSHVDPERVRASLPPARASSSTRSAWCSTG